MACITATATDKRLERAMTPQNRLDAQIAKAFKKVDMAMDNLQGEINALRSKLDLQNQIIGDLRADLAVKKYNNVAKPQSERVKNIYEERRLGATFVSLADKHKLSTTRVMQIYNEELRLLERSKNDLA